MAADGKTTLPTILRIADVADALCISVRQVRRLISTGELPVVHLTVRRRDAGRIPQAAIASTWRTADGLLAFKDHWDYRPAVET